MNNLPQTFKIGEAIFGETPNGFWLDQCADTIFIKTPLYGGDGDCINLQVTEIHSGSGCYYIEDNGWATKEFIQDNGYDIDDEKIKDILAPRVYFTKDGSIQIESVENDLRDRFWQLLQTIVVLKNLPDESVAYV